jgi:hypothetical protein
MYAMNVRSGRRSMMRRFRMGALALATVLALVAAACTGTATGPWPPAVARLAAGGPSPST